MRKSYLLTLFTTLHSDLVALQSKITSTHSIQGSLRIEIRQRHARYYHRLDEKDTCGTYIDEKHIAFARQLAQQDYERKVLLTLDRAKTVISKCIKMLEKCTFPDEIYDGLSKERRALVKPVDSDDEFIKAWRARHSYSPGYFDKDMPYYETDRGDRVRSKTEQMMANMFRASGIAYVVEPAVKTKGKVRRPDFLVLNRRTRQEFYIEHMGMMDDPAYVAENVQKMREYEDVGIYQGKNLILMFSDLKHPLDSRRVKRMIDRVLT